MVPPRGNLTSGRPRGRDRIPLDLDMDAVERPDRRVGSGQMMPERRGHRLAVPLPERGAALDVGEEEGDGAAW
jgi:hypothetical protein